MFHQLAISDTEDVDPRHRDLLPRGRDASERALVGAMIADADHHLVPVSHEVLHGSLHVREGVEVLTEELVRLLGHAWRHSMVDPTGGNELGECSQVPLINDLIKEPLNKSFVLRVTNQIKALFFYYHSVYHIEDIFAFL